MVEHNLPLRQLGQIEMQVVILGVAFRVWLTRIRPYVLAVAADIQRQELNAVYIPRG